MNCALTTAPEDTSTSWRGRTRVTGRANYNFNTRMFVNALLQYNTDARQWSLRDIFLVYNDRHDERSGDLIDRALVAKTTCLVAF